MRTLRVSSMVILVLVGLVGCTFNPTVPLNFSKDATRPEPNEVDTQTDQDTAAPDLEGEPLSSEVCLEYYSCLLQIPLTNGSTAACIAEAPEPTKELVLAIEDCRREKCSDTVYLPDSVGFSPAKFRDCMKYFCYPEWLECLAVGDNSQGCKTYLTCEQGCSAIDPSCEIDCMAGLSADDVDKTAQYLDCKYESILNPSKEKLCECGAICNVIYPTCR